jgi:hypothetical protein
MSETISKTAFLENLRSAHADLQATIDRLSEDQLTRAGVIGAWSLKDLIAHLTYWERRAAFLLESALNGYRQEADIWKIGTVDEQNERNFDTNVTRPLAHVLADWNAVLKTLVALIERLPEEKLASDYQPDWLDRGPLSTRLHDETYGHIEEHLPDLQSSLVKLKQ